ncbi:K(+) efflux antiporter 2 [Ranunculus cassubicifolius]
MDVACCLQHPNVFNGGGLLNSQLRFRGNKINASYTFPSINRRNFLISSSINCTTDSHQFYWKRSFNGNLSCFRKLRLKCQGSDSLAFIDEGNGRNSENTNEDDVKGSTSGNESSSDGESSKLIDVEVYNSSLENLKELLYNALKELEVARLNSTMFETKAETIAEAAIAMKDEAASAWNDVNDVLDKVKDIISEEIAAKEVVQKATMAFSMAEARLQLAVESLDAAKETLALSDSSTVGANESDRTDQTSTSLRDEEEVLLAAQDEIGACKSNLANCESELKRLQSRKEELQEEVDRLTEVAEKAQISALKAEEDVTNIMQLAEQAVAFEVEATKRVNDAEIAIQKAEKLLSNSVHGTPDASKHAQTLSPPEDEPLLEDDENESTEIDSTLSFEAEGELSSGVDTLQAKILLDSDGSRNDIPELNPLDDPSVPENGKVGVASLKEADADLEKSKNVSMSKKQDAQKERTKDSSPPSVPKTLLNKSSRFFPASFFSSTGDGAEFTLASALQSLGTTAREQLPKLILGVLLVGGGLTFLMNRVERSTPVLQQSDVITTSFEEVSENAKPLVREIRRFPKRLKNLIEKIPHQEINEEEASLFDMLWLLLASVIFVPLFQKMPGGSPVLGYLTAGILIGPYGLSIIRHVHGTKAIAEFGVVFLLFNIGLELSVERLSSMKKYVFGLGSAQVLITAVAIGLVTHFVCGQPGPAAIVIGNGLALSSTAVVLQVLQERGESTSRHGRATFSVLLFQDLAVVVLLILIPLISPNSSKGGIGFQAIAEALGLAAVKAMVAISAIIAGGRLLLRPIYRQIAENQNAEIFSANTLLVILGTSLLTARAGLSMALGAFLAGLLLAETEFSLQVESDIAPYRGLLLGLFFMTVGMSIDPKLLLSNFPVILGSLGLLIGGKTLLVAVIGKLFGISLIAAIRVGLLLAPGGEFAFVAFGDAVNQGIMSPQLSSLLFLVVGISMAITPWLAAGGQLLASRFEQHDVRSLLPVESETDDLQDHIIICGFGRVGQIIAQLLSERLIPFVALDVRSERVAVGRAVDLPVYFGDAGSKEVLHKVGAERAAAAAITLDTPGANYRTVWALSKYFPNVKTFVRAHDVNHGVNLEKAGATAVVPETLEPSLQLAAAVLAQVKLPTAEIAAAINEFRTRHLSELTELCEASGSSLGYGFSRVMSKPKTSPSVSDSDEAQLSEGTLAI